MEWWLSEWPVLIGIILKVAGVIFLMVLAIKFFYWLTETLNEISTNLAEIVKNQKKILKKSKEQKAVSTGDSKK